GKIILLAFVAQLCAINILSLYFHREIYLVTRLVYPGIDFVDFYDASYDYVSGLDPYQRERFNKPPPVVAGFTPFLVLNKIQALHVYFTLDILLIGTALYLAWRWCPRIGFWKLTAIASLYYPIYFQLERGNLESIVMVGLAVLIFHVRRDIIAGVALAV